MTLFIEWSTCISDSGIYLPWRELKLKTKRNLICLHESTCVSSYRRCTYSTLYTFKYIDLISCSNVDVYTVECI